LQRMLHPLTPGFFAPCTLYVKFTNNTSYKSYSSIYHSYLPILNTSPPSRINQVSFRCYNHVLSYLLCNFQTFSFTKSVTFRHFLLLSTILFN
jgi:hypothetical protein